MESNYNMNSGISAERNAGYFPFEYFAHFLEFLRARDDIFEFITYNDLPWGDDFDSVNSFPQEHKNWKRQIKNGERCRNPVTKPYYGDSYQVHVPVILLEL